MRARMAVAIERMKAIHAEAGDNAFSDEQDAEFTKLDEERASLKSRIEREERRATIADSLRSAEVPAAGAPVVTERGEARGPNVNVKNDPFEVLNEYRSMAPRKAARALVDAALRVNEGKIQADGAERAAEIAFERTLKRHAENSPAWAASLVARSRDEYTSGFEKYMVGNAFAWDNEERAAMVIGTNTAGGYLVPTHLDPSLFLFNNGVSNIMRQYATVKTLTEGETWNGVSTAGATAAWGDELIEVPDITPSVNKAGIDIKKAHGIVTASIEATQDIPALVSDLMMVLADARDRHEAVAHMTGTGATGSAGQPFGLFTALDANTNVEIATATGGTIATADLKKVFTQLPVRYRSRASWLMNPLFSLAIKDLGTAVSSAYSGDLTTGGPDRIYSKPVVETDEAPSSFTSTTQIENILVFGDLSQYFIIDKPGSVSIEYIPHLFNVANNLPDGRRGWYMYWRTGADVWNDSAFRLLQDKTTA